MTKKIVEIRDALKNQIINYNITDVGSRVFTSRVLPYQDSELPCIAIYFNGLDVAKRNEGHQPESQYRALNFSIFVIVKIADDYETKAINIFGELEKAIATDYLLGLSGLVDETIIQDVVIENAALGETDVSILKADYNINYLTSEDKPDA